MYIKDAVKSVLRIGSAHNKGGPADINFAQISHFSNELFCHKTLVYEFLYITDFTASLILKQLYYSVIPSHCSCLLMI